MLTPFSGLHNVHWCYLLHFSPEDTPLCTTKLHHLQKDDAILSILYSSMCTTTTEVTFTFKYMYTS